ncbi:MAG TPA: hypothetical protein VIO61_01015 [Anaerolineaceae bacterium]
MHIGAILPEKFGLSRREFWQITLTLPSPSGGGENAQRIAQFPRQSYPPPAGEEKTPARLAMAVDNHFSLVSFPPPSGEGRVRAIARAGS